MVMARMRYVEKNKHGYYFHPTKAMKEFGLRSESLGKDEAKAFARAAMLLEDWDRFRKGDNSPKKSTKGTIQWLVEMYQISEEYKGYKPKTQKEFDRHAERITKEHGQYQAAAIGRTHIKGFYRELLDAVSADSAARTIKHYHILLELARDEGLIQINHASRMKLPQGNARNVVWTEEEVVKLVAACIKTGRRSIGLAVQLAYDLGQRLGDIITMSWKQYNGSTVLITQSKTGATILVPVSPELKTMLDETDKDSTHIVVSEETKHPYKADNFSHRFRQIANKAGFTTKQFLDLRRSAAVRLAEAGCTTEEIVAITGHSIEHGAKILEVYIPRSSAMAKAAVDKRTEKNKSTQKVRSEES